MAIKEFVIFSPTKITPNLLNCKYTQISQSNDFLQKCNGLIMISIDLRLQREVDCGHSEWLEPENYF